MPCECSDLGCPTNHGPKECRAQAEARLFRVDMEDNDGTNFCELCAEDAMESGLFTGVSPEDSEDL